MGPHGQDNLDLTARHRGPAWAEGTKVRLYEMIPRATSQRNS
jgi:hypothetical protein